MLDSAYEEVDVSIGTLALKGLFGLYRNPQRFRDRDAPASTVS